MTAPVTSINDPSITRTRVRPNTTEGVPGMSFFGGYINRDEKNAKLTGPERYTTFSDLIANTSIIAAGVRYYLNLISKAGWTVQPATVDGVRKQKMADEMADIVDDIINDMRRPWHRVVRRAAMYRFYGFSIQEWTAKKREDGVIGFLDIAPRPQHTIEQWDLETDGTVLGMVQRSPQDGHRIYLNRGKVVYMVEDSISDNPEGLGLLRHMVDANQRLKLFEKLESYSFETDLRGIPIIKGPFAAIEDEVRAGTLTREDANKMILPMQSFIENHIKSPTRGLLLDSEPYRDEGESAAPSAVAQWQFEVANGGEQGLGEVAQAIERLTRELARIMGVEGLLLGGSNVGSLALSQDKSQTFGLIIDSSLTELTEQFQQDIIDPLWALNGWDDELRPTFKTEQVQYRDVNQITQALSDIATAGAPLDPDWEGLNTLMDLLGLPKIDLEARAIDAALPEDDPAPPEPEGDEIDEEDEVVPDDEEIDEEDDQ
ncbi:MAG: hypothetical protein WBG86_14470 [Polyangiales bacterium]